MTIFKTQLKKDDKKESGVVLIPPPSEGSSDDPVPARPSVGVILAARRRTRLTNTCIALSALLVMSIGVVGGIYIYKHFVKSPYVGTCGVRYERIQEAGLQRASLMRDYMEEKLQIDREGRYERIEVPEFDECNRAVVVHEFVKNLTAIVDHAAGHCFIMPLNRREVRPPKDFWDLISKLRSGYYMPNSRIVRHYYKVEKPAVQDTSIFGPYIANECYMLETYRLKKRKRLEHEHRRHRSSDHDRKKRSAEGLKAEKKAVTYGVYSGVNDVRDVGLIVEMKVEF